MKMNDVRRWVEGLPSGLFTGVTVVAILWLTLAPQPLPESDVSWFEGADKVVHACMFGGLMFMMGLDWRRVRRMSRIPVWVMGAVCVAFGGVIEVVQGAMGMGRGADVWDFVADAAGVGVSMWLTPIVLRWMWK